MVADSATIIVAEDKQAHVEISANADLKNPLVDIGNASLGLQVAYSSGHVLTTVGASGITPLFRALSVKQEWFSNLTVGILGDEDFDAAHLSDSEIEQAFEEISI